MKKFGLYLVCLYLSVFFLASCMKGSNTSSGTMYGIFGLNSNNVLVLKTSSGDLYSSSLQNLWNEGKLNLGDCYYFSFNIDYDLPENSPSAIEISKYYVITLNQIVELPVYNLNYSLVDTSRVLSGETPITKVMENGVDYISGYFFIPQVVNQQDDAELMWSMSFDYNTMMPTEENGKRYYDLFVRATIVKESNKTAKTEIRYVNVYNVGSHFTTVANREKSHLDLGSSYSESSSRFILRLNYVSSIDETTQSITWKSEEMEFLIASFLTDTFY